MKQLTIYLMLIGSVFGLRADINNDGRVDLLDLAILSEEWLMAEYGPELVTNGGFADGTGWTLSDGGFADGKCTIAGGGENLKQSISVSTGLSYLVALDITYGSGLISDLGGTALELDGTGIRSISETVVCGSDDTDIYFQCDAAPGAVTIDNVSVRAVSVAANIETAIFDILRGDSTVYGLVSSRIYPQIIPQNTALPAIIYSQIAGPRQHTLESTDNMVPSRWQFTCVAETYAELRGLSDAIRGVLDSYMGVCGTVEIQCAHFIDENDLTDVLPGTDKLRRYMKAIDFYIWYNE